MFSLTLHHYWRSSCSWRVRWALELKGLKYKSVHVNLLKQENRREDYLKLHPGGFVPALVSDGFVLNESLAILEWLEENFPAPALLPMLSIDRVKVRQLSLIFVAGVQPLQNLNTQKYFSNDSKKREAWAKKWIIDGLNNFETVVSSCSGKYSFKDSVTFADLCLIPQCYNALRFGIGLESFPIIERIYKTCLKDEACKLSSPDSFKPK